MSVIEQAQCKLSPYSPLEGLTKTKCEGCGKRRMYFCYDCRILLQGVFSPHVKLPCDVDIVKHPMEKNSKSSAIHCKIVAPEQTRIFDVPAVYDYSVKEDSDKEGSNVLVFPSPSAVSIEEFVRTNGRIKRFVVLDCTWFQVNMMQKIPQIRDLPCVSLTNYRTAFWRPQHNVDDHGLATIEAIYYAQREYQEYLTGQPYGGEFDDLLYWFFHTRQHVDKRQEQYRKRKVDEDDRKEQ
ncbi:DTW domain-containing protein [Trichostrongylus colubriformis]|uniref:tRNA-uridine aminocarboxypropyltransferase 1 n=1 Tax=Trichostrongylus colubriformis TaxID=6319 RepID=A0AAN8FPC1_TRICO